MATIQAFFDKDSQRKAFINAVSGCIIPGAQDVQFNPKAFFICFQPIRSADTARLVMLARNYGAVLVNIGAEDAALTTVAGKYEKLLSEYGICAKVQCVGSSWIRFFVDSDLRMKLVVFMISAGYAPVNSNAEYVEFNMLAA